MTYLEQKSKKATLDGSLRLGKSYIIGEFKVKKLFVLLKDGGDGSYHVQYTLNQEWINRQEELDANGELDYDSTGCQGNGFHYHVLTIPDECTLKSLGIIFDCAAL